MSTETEHAEHSEGVEDFDAFWASRKRKDRATTIMGVATKLPPSLPLQFEMEAKRLSRSKRDKDVRKLVGILFGEDALAKWSERGMDLEQFMVLLAWAPRAIAGQPVTLAEVADEVAARLAEDRAKAASGEGDAPGEA